MSRTAPAVHVAHESRTLRIAAVGFGIRTQHMTRLMCRTDPGCRVAAVADPATDVVRARLSEGFPDPEQTRLYPDVDALLAHADDFDAFVIGTRCNLHAPLAVKLAATGLPVFLEKPVAISWQQLADLRSAYGQRGNSVVVSFPLRLTAHVRTAVDIIRSGRLGAVNQVQAVNNVPYGGVYFGQWYRDYDLTGGLWLQKATHDFDYINALIAASPVSITAMHSRTAYGGQMPPDLVCSKCDLAASCKESPGNLLKRGDDGGILNHTKPYPGADHACSFSSNIRHQDAGSAILMYDNGAHANYAQNFLVRRSAGLRGATVIGYDGTLSFNWQTDTVRVIDHHRDHVEQIPVQGTGNHGGGDERLAANFLDVVRGRDTSHSPLEDGLLSAAMCLAAKDSAATGTHQRIPLIGQRTGASAPPSTPPTEIEPIS